MAADTVSIKAEGKVSIEDFRTVVDALADLLAALTREAGAKNTSLKWEVDDLRPGSATIVMRGVHDDAVSQFFIKDVVGRYQDVAQNAHVGRLDKFTPAVQAPVRRLANILNGRVTDISLGASAEDSGRLPIDRALAAPFGLEIDGSDPVELHAFVRTSIRGKIVTLDDKQALYFTLQQAGTNENVRCYPKAGDVETRKKLSEYWENARWVLVEGTLNQHSAVPTLYEITDIVPFPVVEKGSWRKAIGIAPRNPGGSQVSSADAVRKVRNGEA
jgi:hypothetical protein